MGAGIQDGKKKGQDLRSIPVYHHLFLTANTMQGTDELRLLGLAAGTFTHHAILQAFFIFGLASFFSLPLPPYFIFIFNFIIYSTLPLLFI